MEYDQVESMIMKRMKITAQITKESLRNLKAEVDDEKINIVVKGIVVEIKNNVIQSAIQGKTSYIFTNLGHLGMRYVDLSAMYMFIIGELRNVFPDCNIDYVKSTDIEGRVRDSGIRVDWS